MRRRENGDAPWFIAETVKVEGSSGVSFCLFLTGDANNGQMTVSAQVQVTDEVGMYSCNAKAGVQFKGERSRLVNAGFNEQVAVAQYYGELDEGGSRIGLGEGHRNDHKTK